MIPEKNSDWGIMGGIFDPIHIGHLLLAEHARQNFHLSGVIFVVSFDPPHRRQKPVASFEHRITMTKMAAEENGTFLVSDLEKNMKGPGYTLNVIQNLDRLYPEVRWNLILGVDNITIFDSWHQPEKLAEMVDILVGNRPGYQIDSHQTQWLNKVKPFDMPAVDISSSAIRKAIGARRSIRYLVPENVRQFIEKENLYQ